MAFGWGFDLEMLLVATIDVGHQTQMLVWTAMLTRVMQLFSV